MLKKTLENYKKSYKKDTPIFKINYLEGALGTTNNKQIRDWLKSEQNKQRSLRHSNVNGILILDGLSSNEVDKVKTALRKAINDKKGYGVLRKEWKEILVLIENKVKRKLDYQSGFVVKGLESRERQMVLTAINEYSKEDKLYDKINTTILESGAILTSESYPNVSGNEPYNYQSSLMNKGYETFFQQYFFNYCMISKVDMKIISYTEGDISIVKCLNKTQFHKEINRTIKYCKENEISIEIDVKKYLK
jgi:hypothetical protein